MQRRIPAAVLRDPLARPLLLAIQGLRLPLGGDNLVLPLLRLLMLLLIGGPEVLICRFAKNKPHPGRRNGQVVDLLRGAADGD